MQLSTVLDLVGVACLAALAFVIWPPAVLGVIGVASLVASWAATPTSEDDDA